MNKRACAWKAAAFTIATGGLFSVSSTPAYAYLDAGSGSVLLQLLLGGAAGLIVALRLWWRNILTMLGFEPKVLDNNDDGQHAASSDTSTTRDS